jgi:hypothetical protein
VSSVNSAMANLKFQLLQTKSGILIESWPLEFKSFSVLMAAKPFISHPFAEHKCQNCLSLGYHEGGLWRNPLWLGGDCNDTFSLASCHVRDGPWNAADMAWQWFFSYEHFVLSGLFSPKCKVWNKTYWKIPDPRWDSDLGCNGAKRLKHKSQILSKYCMVLWWLITAPSPMVLRYFAWICTKSTEVDIFR